MYLISKHDTHERFQTLLKVINESGIGKIDAVRNKTFTKIFETMEVKRLGKYKCYLTEDNWRGRLGDRMRGM